MIQIQEELFIRLCKYHLLNDDDPENLRIIHNMLVDKAERINKRAEYSKYIKYNINSPEQGCKKL